MNETENSLLINTRLTHVQVNYQASLEDMKSYLKVLRYLFAEACVSDFRQNDLLGK
jgi:hypothetical protein